MWFKVDDDLHAHPKIRDAGAAATGLWVMAGSYSAKYGLDGWVPRRFVTGVRGGARLAAKLVAEGLWESAQRDGKDGWQFHDWDEYQPSAADVDADREANRERQRRFRERKRAEREAARHTTRNGVSNAAPTRPVPGVSPDGDTPPTARNRDGNGARNGVTRDVTDRRSAAAESAESRPEPEFQNIPAVLSSHGLPRQEARNFLAWLRINGARNPNALVSKLHREHELDGRLEEWRLSVEADAQADVQASAPPPGKRTTTHKVRAGFDLAAKYAAEEAAAAGEDASPASLRLIEGA